jgi:hypothetical protein
MNADQIMHVLRLTAMSRVNHPDQQEFCEKLAKLFAERAMAEEITSALIPDPLTGSTLVTEPAVAETPKKRKKAE